MPYSNKLHWAACRMGLETWGCDFMATNSPDIKRIDMADIMRLLKEPGKEEVSVMSAIVYEAIKEDLEEARKAGREEALEEARREYEECIRKVAIGCLMSGVDPDIVAANTGFTLDELMNLMTSMVS